MPGRATGSYAALAGALLLVLLALPVIGLRLGFADYGESTTTRKAYDLRADGSGPLFNGPPHARRGGAARHLP